MMENALLLTKFFRIMNTKRVRGSQNICKFSGLKLDIV